MKNPLLYLIIVAFFFSCEQKAHKHISLPALKISEDKHFLISENGNPFFWLGDTGWLLFTKLTRDKT